MHLSTVQIPTNFDWLKLLFNSIFNFKPRLNWAFYVHHWHSLERPARLKIGIIKRIRREWTNSKNSNWKAPWNRLFHSVNIWGWDHIECAPGRRPLGWGCDGIGGLTDLLFCAANWSRQPMVFRRLSRSCYVMLCYTMLYYATLHSTTLDFTTLHYINNGYICNKYQNKCSLLAFK